MTNHVIMRKYLLLLLCIFVMPQMRADDFKRAQHILDLVKAGQGDSLVEMFHPAIKESLPAPVINRIWKQLVVQSGELKKQMEWTATHCDTLLLEQCDLVFDTESVHFSLLTDENQYVVGFHFTPVKHLFDSLPNKDQQRWAYRENDTLLVNGRIKLPAVYCRPMGVNTHLPVVVFVHDIGPNDHDATFGPNKPFRDVAHRLAAQGIASVRYDSRTFVYGARSGEMGGTLTYDTEVVDDAVAALDFAARLEEVDSNQVYIVGHSLGGMLAPRVAMLSRIPLAGMVSVAGAARHLEEILRSQVRFMADLQGASVEQADSLTNMLYGKLSLSYRTFAAAYNPVGTARGLKLPMLFLQGGHDFKTTSVDFELWKNGLEGCSNAQFIWLENCDHLMREQPDMSQPDVYMRPGKISSEAIDAVISFIKQHSR